MLLLVLFFFESHSHVDVKHNNAIAICFASAQHGSVWLKTVHTMDLCIISENYYRPEIQDPLQSKPLTRRDGMLTNCKIIATIFLCNFCIFDQKKVIVGCHYFHQYTKMVQAPSSCSCSVQGCSCTVMQPYLYIYKIKSFPVKGNVGRK